MSPLITVLGVVLLVLRRAFLVLGVTLAIICLVDWLIRTRRINPFSRVSRFFRQRVDPLFAPMERRIVRGGGMPTAAPWWTLAAFVILAIVSLSLLEFLIRQVALMDLASGRGPRGILRVLVSWTFALVQIAILVRVVSSWVRVSPYSPWVRWAFVLSEPVLRPLRRVIPSIGMVDITPIVAYFALMLLQGFVLSLL
ncbi:MAG TPA: YggT family protein [Gemmatimonadaceae bacterium]|nr:YggT family protein [Gemmatimonadaceae bacterium]